MTSKRVLHGRLRRPSGELSALAATFKKRSRTPCLLVSRKFIGSAAKTTKDRCKLRIFVTSVGGFMKAYAILWQKFYARFSEHTFDQRNRVLASRVATHLDIRDRVSMKTGNLG
jgi:hypothetical protein